MVGMGLSRPWQLELVRSIKGVVSGLPQVAELWVLGSARTPDDMDQWSDVDLGLVLTGPVPLATLLSGQAPVWAVDRQADGSRSTSRVVLADGRRVDFVVGQGAGFDRAGGQRLHARQSAGRTDVGATVTGEPPTDARANQARFIAAQAMVKHGRLDLLIASHLTLELAQLSLVEAMLLRDRDEGTNSHRFGTGRDDLASSVWSTLGSFDDLWENRLEPLTAVFDRLHGELVGDYVPDWSGLEALPRP